MSNESRCPSGIAVDVARIEGATLLIELRESAACQAGISEALDQRTTNTLRSINKSTLNGLRAQMLIQDVSCKIRVMYGVQESDDVHSARHRLRQLLSLVL